MASKNGVPERPAPPPWVPATWAVDIAAETTTSCSVVTVASANPPGFPEVMLDVWVGSGDSVVAASAYPPIMASIAAIVTR